MMEAYKRVEDDKPLSPLYVARNGPALKYCVLKQQHYHFCLDELRLRTLIISMPSKLFLWFAEGYAVCFTRTLWQVEIG